MRQLRWVGLNEAAAARWKQTLRRPTMRVAVSLKEGGYYRVMGSVCRYEGQDPESGSHRFEDAFGRVTELTVEQIDDYLTSGFLRAQDVTQR